MGVYSVNLVGEHAYQAAIGRSREGDLVDLLHEPTNPYDDTAVLALTQYGELIGYLARDSWLKRLILLKGKTVSAKILRITGGWGDKPSMGVVLEVTT